MHAARYAAPAGVLITPPSRLLVASGTSQIDPFEVDEPESGLTLVSFLTLLSILSDFTKGEDLGLPSL